MASDLSMPEAVELTDSNRSVPMGSSSSTGLAVPVDQDRDHSRGGEPTTAITLVEYGDYECPYSRAAYRSVQQIEQQLGDRLRFVFRHFPLREIHPHAQIAAEAAEEAATQDRFWEMHDVLFARQHALARADLISYANDLGLDAEQFKSALRDGRHRARIEEDVSSGTRSGVQGTPTLFIAGELYAGSYMPEELERALLSQADAL
ncbi:MAG TPA: thioredoxin domain-containing protein [Solirubrobacteraceae bacterium]|jgi:protein-disulfide isomerase|nr:thioredoxin domain-containing protein [Solirubrobacteraceae bacterium]